MTPLVACITASFSDGAMNFDWKGQNVTLYLLYIYIINYIILYIVHVLDIISQLYLLFMEFVSAAIYFVCKIEIYLQEITYR